MREVARDARRKEPATRKHLLSYQKKYYFLVAQAPSVTANRDSSLSEGALRLCKFSISNLPMRFVSSLNRTIDVRFFPFMIACFVELTKNS